MFFCSESMAKKIQRQLKKICQLFYWRSTSREPFSNWTNAIFCLNKANHPEECQTTVPLAPKDTEERQTTVPLAVKDTEERQTIVSLALRDTEEV